MDRRHPQNLAISVRRGSRSRRKESGGRIIGTRNNYRLPAAIAAVPRHWSYSHADVTKLVVPLYALTGCAISLLAGLAGAATESRLARYRRLPARSWAGPLPARPEKPCLVSGSCSSARGFTPRCFSARSSRHIVLRFARSPGDRVLQRTFTSRSVPILDNRVGGGLTPAVLPHHLLTGSILRRLRNYYGLC